MTTITAPQPAATHLRLTQRGRRVFTVLAAAPIAAAIALAIVSGGGAVASGEVDAPTESFAEVTVMPGDTLWSIAGEVAPGEDPRDVVAELMRLNALTSSGLDAGQTLAIPAEYSAGQ